MALLLPAEDVAKEKHVGSCARVRALQNPNINPAVVSLLQEARPSTAGRRAQLARLLLGEDNAPLKRALR